MTHLKRKADIFLEKWKADPDRLPLIIKGARQVGKTESIREFAKKHYSSVIEISSMTALRWITSSRISLCMTRL